MDPCIALIVAAGRGHRFGGSLPKQYRRLGSGTVIGRTLSTFADHPSVSAIRVVIHPDDAGLYREAIGDLDLLEPVPGGASRQDSVRLGLESLIDLAPTTVLIHDAARPFVDAALVSRVIAGLKGQPGAIPALPVVDTLKRARADEPERIDTTVDRAGLFRAQTPQGFHFDAILKAHRDATGHALTDDAAVAEHAGLPVALVDGSEENLKVTTESDLTRAEQALASRYATRVGSGFDVHRFGPGDHVVLGGLSLPHTAGLAGHSDADVVLHALTDALLGAVGAGDIGQHFPPSEARWRGAASSIFVAEAVAQVRAAGGTIVNADLTVIGERPKIGPHRDAMRESIAAMLGVPRERVNIKATTTERLGFTGREEGLAAQALVSVRMPEDT